MRLPSLVLVPLWLAGASCSYQPKPVFDGNRAYQYLIEQCEFGPRYPGSAGHQQALEYLKVQLQKHSPLTGAQEFSAANPLTKEKVVLTNLQATFYPDQEERILFCAHWDTRPWADSDPDSTKTKTPILGANDGASGVSVLLHLAEIVAKREPKYGVDLVFFDGEDMGIEGEIRSFALGSQHFAEELSGYRPQLAILLDMVGDKDLKIYQERYSAQYAPALVNLIWDKAKELGLACFIDSVGYALWDDHVPLLQRGIACVDIIDFDYPYWHTTQDTPDKCSPESLEKIGRLLVSILYD
jgi:Zn-dependent M28 family amino/carboxypeptidase